MNKRLVLALLAILALVLGACSSDDGGDDTETGADAGTDDAGDDGGDDAADDDGGDDGGDDDGGAVAVPDNPDIGVESDVIKIGWMGDATGPTASAQAFNLRGSEAAVAWYNENGGVLGRQLELVVEDDQFSAETAATNFASLIDDEGVVAIVQMGGSGISVALMPQVVDVGVPVISQGQTIDAQLDEAPTVLNNMAHYGDEADAAVAYMGEQLGGVENAVVAVVQLELPSGDEWDVYIQDSLEKGGGTYVGRALLNPAAPDYAGAVTQIQQFVENDGVNYLAIHGAPSHGLGFVTEMVSQGLEIPIVGIHGMAGGSIYLEGPPQAPELIRGVHSFVPVTSDCEICGTIMDFVAGTEWEDDVLELNFADGWQDIMIVVEGLERAAAADGEITWDGLVSALRSAPIEVGGLTCTIDWTESTHSPCAAPFEWTGDGLEIVGGFAAYEPFFDGEYGLLG